MRKPLHQVGPPRALCFIVDDEPAVGRFIALALRNFGEVDVEQFLDVPSMDVALSERVPDLIFLDVSLGDSDAIEAIRHLSAVNYDGVIQLISGSDAPLLENVRLIGDRRGLRMRPALTKPFRVGAIKTILEEEKLLFGRTQVTAPAGASVDSSDSPRLPDIDLREALERNWLELWYQPKLDLHRASLAGAEGLARVRHPEHGVVPPAAFLPGASSADLIELAEHGLRTVLHDAGEFADAGRPMRLAINVPVEALLTLPIAAIVRDARPRGGAWPGIILEVTEDQIIRDIPAAHEIATQLRIHHIALALDDFGNGYSSLARLRELPFAELKLDRSFVDRCSVDPTNAALCRTAAELAHRFDSVAVAEGIETKEDLATIQSAGCDIGQGFLFSQAIPKEILLARLAGRDRDSFAAAIRPPRGLQASA